MKILVTENSGLILENLGEMISTYKQTDKTEAFYVEAGKTEAVRILKPDQTIVEVRMPGLSGQQVLREIIQNKKNVSHFSLTFYACNVGAHFKLPDGAEFFFSKTYAHKNSSQEITSEELKEKTVKKSTARKSHLKNKHGIGEEQTGFKYSGI